MAVLTETQINAIVKERAQFNVSTDSPVSTAELLSFVNEAYSDVWALSGGRTKLAAHGSAWSSSGSSAGVETGALTDIEDVLHIYSVLTSALLSISCDTLTSTTVTSSAAFGSVEVGMILNGDDIPVNTVVTAIASTSSLTISNAATGTSTATRTFTSIKAATELDKTEMSRIDFLRGSTGYGTYSVPKLYVVSRLSTSTAANVNKLRLDYHPSVSTSHVFPIKYVPQFVPLAATETPDVNDIESRDIALLAAAKLAPLLGRSELVPSIMMDVSERTARGLERKFGAMMDAKQDK